MVSHSDLVQYSCVTSISPLLSTTDNQFQFHYSLNFKSQITRVAVDLCQSELVLRRSHHVLMHFHIHSLPPDAVIRIPGSIGVLCGSAYSSSIRTSCFIIGRSRYRQGNRLWPWTICAVSPHSWVTRDEDEFYLASAQIELHSADTPEIIRATMDELFVGDMPAARRITQMYTALFVSFTTSLDSSSLSVTAAMPKYFIM